MKDNEKKQIMTEKTSYTREDLKFIDDCVSYLKGNHIFSPKYGYILTIEHPTFEFTKDWFFGLSEEDFNKFKAKFIEIERDCDKLIEFEKKFFQSVCEF